MHSSEFLNHPHFETYLITLALGLLLLGGAALRLYVVNNTTVDTPYRVDAADYYNYAYNLRHYGVYSRDGRSVLKRHAAPVPDAVRSPGYPLFLTLFALLLAVVFCMLAAVERWRHRPGSAALVAGLLLGAATLTRPVLELYLPLLLAFMVAGLKTPHRWRPAVLLAAGFALVYVPWVVRNDQAIGHIHDTGLVIGTLAAGMYPDLMYRDEPVSLGVPYRFDPHAAEITQSVSSTLEAIARRFEHHPWRELRWYLFGKPVTLWSWNLVGGAGDVFVYDVLATPYAHPGFLRPTHALMYGLHWLLVVLALLASIGVWLPRADRYFKRSGLFLLRAVSLLLFYNTALLMVGAPYPRYLIPFLPMVYGMAGVAVCALAQEAAKRRRGAFPDTAGEPA